jgi:tetratricopeptide (TPR) repeat protein
VLEYGNQALSLGSAELDYGTLNSYMGYTYMTLKQFENAETQFTSALEHGQPEASMRYYRGVSRMAQGRAADAVEDFTAAIAVGETTSQCYYNRGACYLQLGENDKTLADMQEVAKINDDAELTAIAQKLIEQLQSK